MVEIFYRYRVHPTQARAFEHAYGPQGPWAKLFAAHRGFCRVRLFRHKLDPSIYVTIDVWNTKASYEAFREQYKHEYRRLDSQLALLKMEERLLGFYEGAEEYLPPANSRA